MRKKFLQAVSLILVVLSIASILYGSMKLARAEEAISPKQVELVSPEDSLVISEPVLIRKETAQTIIGTSLVILVVGTASFVFSSRLNEELVADKDKLTR